MKNKDTIGTTLEGEILTFEASNVTSIYKIVYAGNQNLKHIDIGIEANFVYCNHNHLKYLKIPKTLKYLTCENNQLETLKLSEGLLEVNCMNNQLKKLRLPKTLKDIVCDKDLFDYDKCQVKRVNIHYGS